MIARIAVIFAAVVTGLPVHALSCAAPDPVASAQRAFVSSETYQIVKGRLRFDPPPADAPAGALIPATIEGEVLTGDGFVQATEREVFIRPICRRGECGAVQSDSDGIAFLRNYENAWIIDATLCPVWFLPNPTDAQIEQIEVCAAGGPCQAGQ